MPIFHCNSNPRDLVESFIDACEGLATQSTAQMKLKLLEVETAIKRKLNRTLEISMNAAAAANAILSSRIIVPEIITKRKMLQHIFCKFRKIN